MEVLNCLSDDQISIEKRLRLAKNCLVVTTGLLPIGNQAIFDWLVDELVTTDEGISVKDSAVEILSKFLMDRKAEETSLNLILKPSHLKLLARQIQESDCEKELQTYIIFIDSCLDHLSLLRCIVKDEKVLLDLTSSVLGQCSILSSFGKCFKLLGRLGFQLQEKNRLSPSFQLLQVFMSVIFPPAIAFLISTPVAENATEAKVRWTVVVQNYLFGSHFYEDWKKFLHSIPETKEEIPVYPDTLKAIIGGCKEQMSHHEKCPLIVKLLVEGFLRRYKKSQTEGFIFMALLLAILGIYPEAKGQPAIITKESRVATSISVQITSKPETQVEAVFGILLVLKEKEYNLMTELNGLSFMSWLQNLVQYLIKELGKTVPKVMKVCEVLMNINPVSIQYVPGPIIKSVLSSRTDVTNHDCDDLLSAILKAFVKLRDVSKFVQLLLQAANLLKLGSGFVGSPFLESLENVVTYELISAQTIKLWELILQGIENDFKSDFVSQPSCLLLGTILISGKLVDHTLPEVQFEEISCLSTRTQEIIKEIFEKKNLDKNDQDGLLKLAVSYNELHSNLMRYVAVYRQRQNGDRMDEDRDSIPGLVVPPKKFKKRVDPSLRSEIHFQFFKLHGHKEFTTEDFDHLHKIEPNSAQFALYCKNSSPEASVKLASLLMTPSHSVLLNVYDIVDDRRIQLGLLLNLIDENIESWSSFTKKVKENYEMFFSNNNRIQQNSLKIITAIVEKDFLERSIDENVDLDDMLRKLEIIEHFPVHSFKHVEKMLLVCYLIAVLGSTNHADISEKVGYLLVCALDSADKTSPILTYFDPNSILPWLVRRGKILGNPKVLKAVIEIFTEIAAKSLGNMENFSGFSKEESTDLSQMAGALFLENLRKGQKRLKKSPNKATADKILKSVIKSFQKSLKASPRFFVDMENSTKNTTLLSICSSILRVYTEAKETEKLKVKTVLNRLPSIFSIAYRGIENGSEEWAEASKELFDIVFVNRKKLARKTPSNVISKLWEAYKKAANENRWHDGMLKTICSIVKKGTLERICNDVVLGLRSAVEMRSISQFKKYNHFLCQIMQARMTAGPRADVRRDALQKCFSLISTCGATWEEKEDIIQSSLVILGSYRALIGSQMVFLSPFERSLCLEAIIRTPFKLCDTVSEFFSIFLPSFKILHAFLTKHEEIAADRMPSVFRCFSILLSTSVSRFHQGKNLTDTELKSGIICAEKLGNIGEVMADQKLRYRRVAPYIIAEMLEQFQKFTLYPRIREQLAHGIYGLMSILDKPAVSQLLVTLSSGPREVFKMEYETYLKYRKYSGKV